MEQDSTSPSNIVKIKHHGVKCAEWKNERLVPFLVKISLDLFEV
jgi:hypothetical protein